MKNKIVSVFGNDNLEHRESITYPQIHVVDLTRRTNGTEGTTIYSSPLSNIATLLIENPHLDITATFFKPQCFQNEKRKEPKNCEGVFYLSNSTNETWVLFLEIKDCEAGNIANYFAEAKEQIITVVKIFRDKKIISDNKRVYANISFPRRNKTDFYTQLIKPGEAKRFLDSYKIFIRGTNNLKIKNNKTIY